MQVIWHQNITPDQHTAPPGQNAEVPEDFMSVIMGK
jgi:hypothetical protein